MTPPPAPARDSDRWVTPGVVIAGLGCATLVLLGVTAGMVYLSAVGRDPGPILELVTQVTTAIASLGSLLLSLVGRRTVAKVERETGRLASALTAPGHEGAPVPAGRK